MPRNPAWTIDELLLALDLYVNHPRARSAKRDPRLLELSETLRSLPIHTERPDPARFRNANSVYLKLQNFKAVDPDVRGVGMRAGAGLREREVFARYGGQPEELTRVAAAIRTEADDSRGRALLITDEEDEGIGEGRILMAAHRRRERRSAARKKSTVLTAEGRLACECCGFDFSATYGEIGYGFAECHHLRPLTDGERTTKLADLAIVCANCHRMIHRRSPALNLAELRALLT